MRNLQEQVKKAFCYQKLFWPFTVWINCSSDLFANSQPSASNFKSFSRSLEHFFLTVGQNNFGNKIPKLVFALHKKLFPMFQSNNLRLIQLIVCFFHFAKHNVIGRFHNEVISHTLGKREKINFHINRDVWCGWDFRYR